MLKIPASMYGKGPKNNPSPGKSWDTSGEHAYGDARLRNLREPAGPELSIIDKQMYDLAIAKKRK